MKVFSVILFAILFITRMSLSSQNDVRTGSIRGRVLDSESRTGIAGATIRLLNTTTGTSADTSGFFELNNVPVGSYSISAVCVGFEHIVKTDIIVSSGKITHITMALPQALVMLNAEVVTDRYFSNTDVQPISAISFSSEEIRRAPGAAGDVSRIIFGLPSLAKINDTKNSLIVRGGSPVENGFFLDNIEIPSINHFPVQGSTEGPIGILNVDFIEDVNFISGGFSAGYGDKLSSIMELKMREGNRSATDMRLEMSMQGFGGNIEGPLNGVRGSYFLSVRRSYLDLILGMMDQKGASPTYSDIQGKATYTLSDHHTLTLLDVFSHDVQTLDRDKALEFKSNVFPDYRSSSNTAGINWQYLWGKSGYSNTSFAHTLSDVRVTFSQTRDGKLLMNNHSLEQEYKLRNTNNWMIDARNELLFGIDAKLSVINYNQFYNTYQTVSGLETPATSVNVDHHSLKGGAFATCILNPSKFWTFSPGARIDYDEFNRSVEFSPRLSITYHIDDITSITGMAGRYYQSIPWVIALQNPHFNSLKTPRADHFILSLNRLLTEDTRLLLDGYIKTYSDFPADPSQPVLFLFDQAVVENVFLNHASLVSNGRARSRGIELTIQKKLAVDFYGMIAASYSKSQYKSLSGNWIDRIYDNRFTFAIEGGYKPDKNWEFSLRWLYAGGAPFTPFNDSASLATHKGVFDVSRINASRLPDFHSLNIRADRRFHFDSSTLIVYLSIWNAYGRKNVASYQWNEIDEKIETENMWGTLPVFGVTYEF